MSNKEQKELQEQAKKTSDAAVKEKLDQAVKSEDKLAQVLDEQAAELRQKEQLNKQQQDAIPTPKPQWLSPANRAVLNLVGFDNKKFNEKNFVETLTKMGISKLTPLPNKAGYSINYGHNKSVEMNLKEGKVTTNDFSEQGFSNVAKVVKASGASGIDMSQFIKQQQQAKNPNLDQFLTTAYKAAKAEGVALVGMEKKQDLMSKLEHKSPVEIPTLKRE